MKNRFRNNYVIFVPYNNFNYYNIFTNNNFLQNFKNKEDKKRYKEKFSITSKKELKENLFGFMEQV